MENGHLTAVVEGLSALSAVVGFVAAGISWTVRSLLKAHAREMKLREELVRKEIKAAAQEIRIRFEKLAGNLEAYMRQAEGEFSKNDAVVRQLRTDIKALQQTVEHVRKKVGT